MKLPASSQSSGPKNTLERLERKLGQISSPEQLCAELARTLGVKQHEVALLKVENGALRFLYPTSLRTAGSIPLSGSAVAARTASTRTTMLSNNFAKVKHVRIFEAVKLGNVEEGEAEPPTPIQKMMSVPIFEAEGGVLGVLQLSRKGDDPRTAGPDFTIEDLRLLEGAARSIAKLAFMQPSVTAVT